MGDHVAFFYGTLMAPQVLHRVCYGTTTPYPFQNSLLTIKPALLHSFSRHKVRFCDYPAIIPYPSPSSSVRGTLVTGLTDGDIWRLDTFEGDEYERKRVKVKVLAEVGDDEGTGNVEGEEVEAETYVWIASKEDLEEGEWDFGDFVREKMKRWVGEDDEYEEVDGAVREKQGGGDPTRGRGKGGEITDVLEREGKGADAILESAV